MNHTALFVNRQQIEASVRRAEQALAETVVRIRHEFKDDWTGDPSIFFYIVLTDETTKELSRNKLSNLRVDTRMNLVVPFAMEFVAMDVDAF